MLCYRSQGKLGTLGYCLVIVLSGAHVVAQESVVVPAPVIQGIHPPALPAESFSAETPHGQLSAAWYPSFAARSDESSWQVVPYGSLWANMWFASSRTEPGSFTLWVSSDEDQGEAVFELDARRSRIGVEVTGPAIRMGADKFSSSGRVELDFFGQFLTENRAGARLRHAYWEAANEEWRFLIGQTWDVISPLHPGMLNFTAGWAGGNIGFRRAQFRAERKHLLRHGSHVLQVSLNQNIIDDFQTDPGVRREAVDFPLVMVRTAASFPLAESSEVIIGFSGHYGQTGFDFITSGPPPLDLPPLDDARFNTWSLNLDVAVPLTADLEFRGEMFHGSNLSPFFGGILQGVCPCLRRPIHATGGWMELVKAWSANRRSHFGFGIDDPANDDFTIGRSMNQFVFGNLIWQVTTELSTGMELNWWRTLYQDRRGIDEFFPTAAGEAITWEWMVRYDF